MPDNTLQQQEQPRALTGARGGAWFALVYVAIVLGVDLLAAAGASWPFDWRFFVWRPAGLANLLENAGLSPSFYTWLAWEPLSGFDVFKFTFWFIVPFLICLWHMDWGAWGTRRWKKMDLWLLGALFLLGIAGVVLVQFIPSLRAEFPSQSNLPGSNKWMIFWVAVFWNLSWVPGWEFMHRYFLLRRLDAQWVKYGWVLVPIIEVAFHYRDVYMAAGMGLFAVIATIWARERRNILLPFIAHFFIEIVLVLFLLFV